MDYYKIKKENKDFKELYVDSSTRGTRRKKIVFDLRGKEVAFFKYQRANYLTESCSEKIAYEIAKELGYECAKIELGQDKTGEIGVLNYFFKDYQYYKDIVLHLNKNGNEDRDKFYNLNHIINCINNIDKRILHGFIRILIFDALIGEQDRHEENWGIIQLNKLCKIAPLFDNGDSLLRDFGNLDFAEKYYSGVKQFNSYILNSKTQIYISGKNSRYKHFDLLKDLLIIDFNKTKKEIINLKKLKNGVIEKVVNMIPNSLMTNQHKKFIILYLIKRRDIILEMV